jgi:hypothetical protein
MPASGLFTTRGVTDIRYNAPGIMIHFAAFPNFPAIFCTTFPKSFPIPSRIFYLF